MSDALKALGHNPLEFLKKKAIVFSPVSVPPEYRSDDGSTFRSGTACVKLVQSSETSYSLQVLAMKDLRTDRNAVAAYVLAYKNNQGNDDVPFVDIPITAYVENTFLFTVGLTGCSVIVTRLNDTTYRVFHDRRMDSAVLYNDVQMYVNFNDYRIGGRYLSRTGNAITLMLFKGGAWNMFLQRQLPDLDTSRPTWEVHAVKQTGPVTAKALEESFNNRRTIIQNRIKSNGRRLKVDDSLLTGAVDGDVGVAYNEQAIRGWNALRSAIKSKIDGRAPNNRNLNDTYDRFADDISDSKQVDETWIWLQIKN